MLRLLTISLFLFASTCFGQVNKKILGKWISCEKIEMLNKFDTLTFVKDDPAVTDKCITKNCTYTQWTFEKTGEDMKLQIYIYKGCKSAATNTSVTQTGVWSADKKNKLTIFDEKYTKHI